MSCSERDVATGAEAMRRTAPLEGGGPAAGRSCGERRRHQEQLEDYGLKQKVFNIGEAHPGLDYQQCPRLEFTRRQLAHQSTLYDRCATEM